MEEKAKQGLRQWHVMLTKTTVHSNKIEKCVVSTKTGKPAVYRAEHRQLVGRSTVCTVTTRDWKQSISTPHTPLFLLFDQKEDRLEP